MMMNEPPPELYDHEKVQAEEILADLNEKYLTRPTTKGNLESLVHEAQDRFAAIGLIITVFPGKRLLRAAAIPYNDPDDLLPEDFTFSITERVDAFDPDRQRAEVQSGVADTFYDKRRVPGSGRPSTNGEPHEHKH
jgi:hypothetical protein